MWEFAAAVMICYVLRRYKTQRYSTQKFSRKCDYMEKTSLAPLKVPWNVKYDEYNPMGEINEATFWWFNITRIDGGMRFLFEVSPYIFRKVPFNPFGRTGVVGKGLFQHFGPNNMVLTIIWSKTLGFLRLVYLKKGKFLYHGYLDHPMNTDNAWVEATIYYLEVQEYPGIKEECPEWLTTFVKTISTT